MSDLQCPARFLLVCAPDASTVDGLRDERVAAVYAHPLQAEVSHALGQALGVPTRELEPQVALDAVLAARPDAVEVLEDLADLHRGETVVVVVVAEGRPAQRAEVAVDADGLRIS